MNPSTSHTTGTNKTNVATRQVTGRRTLKFHTLADIGHDAERFLIGTPRCLGNWTAAQNVQHISNIIRGSRNGFDVSAGWFFKIVGPLMKNMIIKGPMKPGFKIPESAEREFAPGAGVDLNEAVAGLKEEIRLAEMPGAMHHPSPFFGRMSEQDWTQLHCTHAAMHFSFVIPDDSHGANGG